MPQGLPRKIKLAFILQALIGSIAITLGILLAGLAVRHVVLEQRMQREADDYWDGRKRDPSYPLPRTSTTRGHFVPTGASDSVLPAQMRAVGSGLHNLPGGGKVVLVDRREAGSFYLVYATSLIDEAILYTGLFSLLFSLLTTYLISWHTYRTSKRLVSPVSWLANVVSQWDPRDPDTSLIEPIKFPYDPGSEVRRLSSALSGLAERVSDFVQRERDFTRDASHELRTPLTVIQGNLRAILDDVYPLEKAEIATIYDETLLLSRLVGDLRELVQAEAGQLALNLQPVEVEPLIRCATASFEAAASGQGVALVVDVPEHPLTVVADADRVRQILHNLVANALRYTPARGTITIHARTERNGLRTEPVEHQRSILSPQSSVLFTVEDTGQGIAAADLPHVFERFYRMADHERVTGTGLGLAIVRKRVQEVGGSASLGIARNEHGALFHIRIPLN